VSVGAGRGIRFSQRGRGLESEPSGFPLEGVGATPAARSKLRRYRCGGLGSEVRLAATKTSGGQPGLDDRVAGVEGNARITGAIGAAIFVLLFLEGITVLRVRDLITLHVFLGMLLVPFVTVKLGSTGYRFLRYYAGDRAYVEKGPPHVLLRALGPLVAITTVGLLATGIGAVLEGQRAGWLGRAHKAFFILWFGAMTVHVLGHAFETPALAVADLRRRARMQAPGAATRLLLFAATGAVAVVLGFVGIGWAHHWQALHFH
jgi:hypothetical protein